MNIKGENIHKIIKNFVELLLIFVILVDKPKWM